jgi:hypothetical protein
MTGPGPRRASPAARMEKRSGSRMPALHRERPKPHAPVCPRPKSSACWRDFDVLARGFLDQTLCANFPGGKRVAVRRRQDVTSSGGKRITLRARKIPWRAIRGLREDRARQNNISWEAARRAPARARHRVPKQQRGRSEPPKPCRHRGKLRRRKLECNKGHDDGQDRRPGCRTRIRPGRS